MAEQATDRLENERKGPSKASEGAGGGGGSLFGEKMARIGRKRILFVQEAFELLRLPNDTCAMCNPERKVWQQRWDRGELVPDPMMREDRVAYMGNPASQVEAEANERHFGIMRGRWDVQDVYDTLWREYVWSCKVPAPTNVAYSLPVTSIGSGQFGNVEIDYERCRSIKFNPVRSVRFCDRGQWWLRSPFGWTLGWDAYDDALDWDGLPAGVQSAIGDYFMREKHRPLLGNYEPELVTISEDRIVSPIFRELEELYTRCLAHAGSDFWVRMRAGLENFRVWHKLNRSELDLSGAANGPLTEGGDLTGVVSYRASVVAEYVTAGL